MKSGVESIDWTNIYNDADCTKNYDAFFLLDYKPDLIQWLIKNYC